MKRNLLLPFAKWLYVLSGESITANLVTFFSLVTIIPVFMCGFMGFNYFTMAGILVIIHDMLDRLDGCVAVCQTNVRTENDKLFGAFFDAQVGYKHPSYFVFLFVSFFSCVCVCVCVFFGHKTTVKIK